MVQNGTDKNPSFPEDTLGSIASGGCFLRPVEAERAKTLRPGPKRRFNEPMKE